MPNPSIETERKVLGCLINHPDIFADSYSYLKKESFTDERRDIFIALSENGEIPDNCKKEYTICSLEDSTEPIDDEINELQEKARTRTLESAIDKLKAQTDLTPDLITELASKVEDKFSLKTLSTDDIVCFSDTPPLICLADIEERDPEWLIKGYIPKGEITVLAGDGGVGKTFVWCAIAAAISSGQKAFVLNNSFVKEAEQEPQKVLYFSTEDSIEAVLCPRLRCSGAILMNVNTMDIADDNFQKIKFNSTYLENLIDLYRPALVIFDPLQSFLPPNTDMKSRSHMRAALANLHAYGEKYGATFLIIMHTNKQLNVWGRTRLADSADIWDIARSVLICGEADRKSHLKYLSQEKSSYGKLSQTVLFRIENNAVAFAGFTDKRDREYVITASKNSQGAPARESAEQFILSYLGEHGGRVLIREIDEAATARSISDATLRRAKQELIEEGKINPEQEGFARDKIWYYSLTQSSDGRESKKT